MSLNVVSVQPDANSTGVILQGAVIVTFDGEIDTTTYDESSFLLSAPAETPSDNSQNLSSGPIPLSGREYVDGVFSFALNSAGHTVATFRPSRPLRPNVTYTVLITGVQSLSGETMEEQSTWDFTTGVLNLSTPPPQNPQPGQAGRIKPSDLDVLPASTYNNDLHQIKIRFPYSIDPESFDVNDVQVDLEAFLQDLDVVVPPIASESVTIEDDTLIIQLVF